MYRKKERQAASSKGSPGKSAGTSSQEQLPQPPAVVAKETAPLAPPPPPQLDFKLSLSALDFPGMEQLEEDELEGDGEDYVEPPNLDFYHGQDSPFRYIHGAPLHDVVEEEEE